MAFLRTRPRTRPESACLPGIRGAMRRNGAACNALQQRSAGPMTDASRDLYLRLDSANLLRLRALRALGRFEFHPLPLLK
jgi:hypothetical protein